MSVSDLIKSINAVTSSGELNSIDEQQRAELSSACDRLKAMCESPLETMFRLLFTEHQTMVLRLAIDLKLFDSVIHHSSQNETGKVTVAQIASDTKADPVLLGRIMRFVSAMGTLKQHTADTFTPTPLSSSYISTSPLAAAIIHLSVFPHLPNSSYFPTNTPSTHFHTFLTQLPEYFAKNNWTNPNDLTNTPFQFAAGTSFPYFDYLSTKPYYQSSFNTVMKSPIRRAGQPWFKLFPVTDKLHIDNPTPSSILMVDIGGSQGQDLLAFRSAFPDLPGRLILQDLPHVVADAELPDGVIESQGYDFFTEQPVKGAKGYMLRTVLHDWPDQEVVKILSRVREAMDEESVLLIVEKVIPETGGGLMAAIGDLSMMVSFAGAERTEKEYAELLGRAGLRLVKCWVGSENEGMEMGVLEARI
ncbi:S-adenosyl-L-methionine-dependent methyltransferase [Aspergillus phoenicis ATCC 13157]|uniref:S-adenosyl-L-methionine-dependent methyltransferase n=1 Tax=Aspergillus phoenicis ATCC 13157 TaxID=1353007 RepID=A0A370PJI6_ASPPH|nr:S-adenosyl-L-methionine-dependent methyltransferase [Aspergillus phoenicis ATCC 13157]